VLSNFRHLPEIRRERMFPLLPMLLAFAVGFFAGLVYRQMKIIALIIFILFMALISGIIQLSFSLNTP